MKILILGDIHGRTSWKRIVAKEDDAELIIFLGDYVDSFDVPPLTQLDNLNDIINFKKSYSQAEVILLTGNHDYHYMDNFTQDTYSGYQPKMFTAFRTAFKDNEKLFQMAYLDKYNNIYCHAGITESWLREVQITSTDPKVVVDSINELFHTKPNKFKYNPSDRSGIGDSVWQSPIWVRPNSLYKDKFPYFQIVGHTQEGQPVTIAKAKRQGFIVIDCLENGFYLTCENSELETKRL